MVICVVLIFCIFGFFVVLMLFFNILEEIIVCFKLLKRFGEKLFERLLFKLIFIWCWCINFVIGVIVLLK